MPSAAPAILLHSLDTQQGVSNIILAMTRRDVGKPAFSLRKKHFVKTHALSLLGTTRLLSRSDRKQVNDIKNKKLKDVIENMTIGNAISILAILLTLLIIWKATTAKIEEIQLKNIANEASKYIDKEREKEEKMMQHFINQSNEDIKQIQNAHKKGINQMHNPYEQYTNQLQENRNIEPRKKLKEPHV
ncbi:hypothetical protein Mettu_1077 [Methylobacter tundripaludum SV96]|uniref:Uncharacterized protein n=2 Tax=Methylobacter tundripaludum TaxID=173365 RepID=G3ISA1_METTV|nr:hypothetical protein Mettu_1077 [Methylobacter tundripaludum SV96]